MEVQSERMGLRRRALQRRRISVAGFDAAVDRRSMEGDYNEKNTLCNYSKMYLLDQFANISVKKNKLT